MSPRRICTVVNNMDVGGLEKVVITLINRLDRSRFTPYLICLDGEGKLFSELDLPSSNRLVLNKSQARNWGLASINLPMLVAIRSFVRHHQVDLLHAHNLAPLVYAGLGSKLGRRRPVVVYSEHNQIYSASQRTKKRFRQYVRLADQVIAVSHDLDGTLRREVSPSLPIRVIHNGIDGARFDSVRGDEVRTSLGFRENDFVVGTAVVLSEQKGITYLLRAAEKVVQSSDRVHFVIAGDGPLRGQLEAQCREKGLSDRVRFLGYRSDIPQLLASFNLYVLSSLWEGLPLALLEALALGKPIVATTVGGNPEVVQDGVNGYLVGPREPEALADRILDVADDPHFGERIAQANRDKFQRQFSAHAMVQAHETLYEKLTPNPLWRH